MNSIDNMSKYFFTKKSSAKAEFKPKEPQSRPSVNSQILPRVELMSIKRMTSIQTVHSGEKILHKGDVELRNTMTNQIKTKIKLRN